MSLRGTVRAVGLAVAGVAAGNGAILLATVAARRTLGDVEHQFAGIENSRPVNERLWRGSAPDTVGYAAIAAAGAAAVVDLRAEGGTGPGKHLGLAHHRLPIRDGQPPTAEQVAAFLGIVASIEEPVYIHCAAGVGRTGSMVAAYRILHDLVPARRAINEMLAVGPPSLEQIAFAARVGEGRRPWPPVTALSRVLDAPRRTWSRVRNAASRCCGQRSSANRRE